MIDNALANFLAKVDQNPDRFAVNTRARIIAIQAKRDIRRKKILGWRIALTQNSFGDL